MKYKVAEYERFPTLELDDLSWCEPGTKALLQDEMEEIPDELVSVWERARDDYFEAEDAIRAYIKTGLL